MTKSTKKSTEKKPAKKPVIKKPAIKKLKPCTIPISSIIRHTSITPVRKKGLIHFSDYPEFTPNLTPRHMFVLGSFGGTYWRPIKSTITKQSYNNVHKQYPNSWWKDIPENWLSRPWNQYDKTINQYGVKVGTTLRFWESKCWISPNHPYGWVQWYCDFYEGKRCADDARQIKRWKGLAGPKGRFRNMLLNMLRRKKRPYDDVTISPKIRQTLQHWAYKIRKQDLTS